ncbi:MAG: helix-turn-helix transcriptional regulator [Pseudomonadales bacterium]|nr:helix-turn-helix transcriptional regulator [Pseudomonadales bacterium]
MKQTVAHRSPCPISRTLDIMGDKWTLVILRDITFFNRHTYAELAASREKIPTNLLADRLKRLVGAGLLEKVPYQDRPVRYRYQLTEAGQAIRPILMAMKKFGEQHLSGEGTKAP